jgi:GNAT superfamily N-acetyltransferase
MLVFRPTNECMDESKHASRVTTRLPVESDLDADVVKRLSDMINEVYDDAESGMWKRAGTRTDPAAVERLLRIGALILAEIDDALVGSVHVSFVGERVGEFGMLAADPGRRGAGIGSALVRHAESWARQQGCHTMRLELLTPRHWKNPRKEFLTAWYARIGYAPQNTEPLERMYPNLVPELATDCDFTVWHKPLADTR